ncbi:hypothetical protein D3C81_1886790 [compost metagenome]
MAFCRRDPLAEHLDEGYEGIALSVLAGLAILGQWPPGLELLNVLEHEETRFHLQGIAQGYPCQPAHTLADRRPALCFAEVTAVRR